MFKQYALHSPESIKAAYEDITGDPHKFAYLKSILNHIDGMDDGEWFDIAKNVRKENIPAFIRAVCTAYQYNAIFITFNNDFTEFRKD